MLSEAGGQAMWSFMKTLVSVPFLLAGMMVVSLGVAVLSIALWINPTWKRILVQAFDRTIEDIRKGEDAG